LGIFAGVVGIFLSLMSSHNYSSGRSCRRAGSGSFLEGAGCFFSSGFDPWYLVCRQRSERR
jgi:hypothetical protein